MKVLHSSNPNNQVQFVVVMSQCTYYVLRCDYSRRQVLYCGGYAAVMLVLFSNYYYQVRFLLTRWIIHITNQQFF